MASKLKGGIIATGSNGRGMYFTKFNIESGYLDGIVRGYRSGLLTSLQYQNMTQCETLEGTQSLLQT